VGCKVRIDVILIRMARIVRAFWYRARTRPDILGKPYAALLPLVLRGMQGAGRSYSAHEAKIAMSTK